MLMLFLTVLFTVGLLLAKKGWKSELKGKSKLFKAGVSMMATAVLLLVLVMVLLTAVVGIKMFVSMVAGFLALLWAFKGVFIVIALVAIFFWLKNKFSKKN